MRNKFKNLNRDLLHLIQGSSIHAATQVIATGLGFIASTQIARYYGPAVVGNIATITSVLTLFSLISLVGNQTLILKAVPQQLKLGGHTSAHSTYKKIKLICLYSTTLLLAIWLAIEHFTSTSLLTGLDNYLFYTATLIVINVYMILNGKTLRALGDYKYFSLLDFLPASLSLVTASIAITLNISSDRYQYLHFFPRFLIVIFAFYFVIKAFNELKKNSGDHNAAAVHSPSKRHLLRSSFPMLGITISTAAIAHLDIIMLNHYSKADDVGIYSIYVKIVGVAAMASVSINSMFAPKVSTLHTSDDNAALKKYAKQVTLLNFSAASLLTLVILFFHRPLLSYFGPEFLNHTTALYILLSSSLIAAFFGSVGFFLSMTGNQNSFFWIMLGAAIINGALNYLLIPIYGINGAAIATMAATVVAYLLATIKIKSLHNYTLIWTGRA